LWLKGAVKMLTLSNGSAVTTGLGNDDDDKLNASLGLSTLKLIEGRPSAVRCDAVGGYPPPALDLFVGMRDVTANFFTR